MASSVRAFFGGGASSDLCAAKKAATAAFRSPSGPACLRKASSGGVRGRDAGDGFFGWGAAAERSAADFGGCGDGDDDAAAGFRWGGDAFGDVGFGTSAPDASTDVQRIACNPKRCTAAWYSRAAVSSSLYVPLQTVFSDASRTFACQRRLRESQHGP